MFELEQHILATVLCDRSAFNKLQGLLQINALSEPGQIIYQHAAQYYARDKEAQSVDRSLLAGTLGTVFPSPKQNSALVEELHKLPAKVSASNVLHLAHELQKRALGMRLADSLLTGAKDADELLREYSDMRNTRVDVDDFKTQVTVDDIFQSDYSKLPILPRRLNQTLRGGIRPGQSTLIFGRPGAAKTLLCVNIAGSLAARGHRLLHIINEEAAQSVALRYLSLLASGRDNSGPTLDDMGHADEKIARQHVEVAMQRAKKAGYDNVHIVYGVTGLAHARQLIERVQPRVLVLDQIRNMSAGGDGMTQNLEIVTRELRKWCHEFNLVGIGVSQAGESAEGKLILRLTDLDSSKTGVQGACDLMLGIGVTPEVRTEGKRWVSVCRNKMSGVIEDFQIVCDEQHTKIIEQLRT